MSRAEAQRVVLVGREVVGQARGARVHLRAAELLGVGVLAGRHLHQRRPTEEHARAVADEHGVVAQPGHVRAAGGGAAEHERERRDVEARQAGEVAEHRAAGDELVRLRRQVGAARLDEVDQRQPVALGDLLRAQRLAQRVGVVGPAADRGVVAVDHALDALDDADARDDAAAHVIVGPVRDERLQLEERAVAVEQQLDPLADQQLAALPVALDVLRPAAAARRLQQLLELLKPRAHRLAVERRRGAGRVEAAAQDCHGSSSAARRRSRSSGRAPLASR